MGSWLAPRYQNTFSSPTWLADNLSWAESFYLVFAFQHLKCNFCTTNTSNGERTSMLDGLHYLPKLRHLYRDAQHLKSLPSWSCASFLLELSPSHSSTETVWKASEVPFRFSYSRSFHVFLLLNLAELFPMLSWCSKTLGNLRSLDLTSYKHLTEFLNLLKAD